MLSLTGGDWKRGGGQTTPKILAAFRYLHLENSSFFRTISQVNFGIDTK